MRMMRLPAVWTTNLVALLFGVGMFARFGFLPQFLQTPERAGYGFGATVTESGLLMLPQAVATFVAGLAAGAPRRARTAPRPSLVVGASLTALRHVGSRRLPRPVLAGRRRDDGARRSAFGLAFAAIVEPRRRRRPAEQTGVASGMNANIRTDRRLIGAAVMARSSPPAPGADGLPVEAGYTHGFAVLGVALVVAALAGLTIPTLSGREVEERLEEPATSVVGSHRFAEAPRASVVESLDAIHQGAPEGYLALDFARGLTPGLTCATHPLPATVLDAA